ncbi:hypothetical protein BG011_005596 [Mortierella polycephala]|uniref:MICOS complex subunit n=1 Tax=Mortierella polycephala TaxID=41804 RepID=A0A9P6QGK1_9FUNG|nr:hypothetical protein BG011_005596 [Mortierella polycephala]
MYRIKPQALAVVRRAHNDSDIQAQADHLKEHVQEFTDQVLEMADSPYDNAESPEPSSHGRGNDHGHGSSFFSSMGNRNVGSRTSEVDHASGPYKHSLGGGRMERFRGAYVEEPLIPALFYISVAGLTGSLIARKSNIAFRFFSPLALALGASAYCIPKTTNNVIHGLRTFEYREWYREWQDKYVHAKKSLVDTTHGLTAVAGTAAHEAKDVVHDLSDKTHELTDKTQKVLKDVKDKSVEVAHELKDKGADVVTEVKNKSHDLSKDLGNQLEHTKDKVEDKADEAKHWWNAEKRQVEKSAKDMKRSAREMGEDARDWVKDSGEDARDWARDRTRKLDKDDIERGADQVKARARRGWDTIGDEVNSRGRGMKRQAESLKDQTQDWAQDRSRQWQGRAKEMKDRGQDWAQDRSRDMKDRFEEMKDRGEEMKDRGEDWARDRQRDAQRYGQRAEDRFDQARDEFNRRGREARDFSEDQFKDAKRDVRNRAEDMQDYGRRQSRKFEHELDDTRLRTRPDDRSADTGAGSFGAGWGFGRAGQPGEDVGGRRGRFEEREEYAGRSGRPRERSWSSTRWGDRGDRFDSEPRRSVTEAAREGKHWWQHKDVADPYEAYDRERPSSSPWWKAGSASQERAQGEFEDAKHHAQRGFEHVKDTVEEKAQSGRSWLNEKTNEFKHRFDHGDQYANNEIRDKLGRAGSGYRNEQGRDFGGMGRNMGHNHASIYSNDSWFHYDHGEDNRASAGRGRERGM